jgi:DHA2 family multidrug resistance protein
MTAAADTAAAPVHRGLITLSIMLATIMQAVDMTIANVALPNMQGTMSATQDQISWVLTSYIVATAIMTPPTGYLAARFGRQRLFAYTIAAFALTSLLCGLATSLEELVFYRILQGAAGAGLVPLSQAVLLDTYPTERHGQAMAIWGIGVMIGPILGPTLGGWLTDEFSWRWIFLINLPFGVLAMIGIVLFVPETEKVKRRFDVFGFTLLAISIGALQMMLDRGESQGWFDSAEILIEGTLAAVALYMFVVHIFTAEQPFLEPALFKDRNFAIGLFMIFILGIILLATLALLPPFLQHLSGYPVLTTGIVMAPRGAGVMVAMFIVGRLVGRVDARLLIAAGYLLAALSLWQMSQWTADVSMTAIIVSAVIQGMGLGMVFVPLSTVGFATLAPRFRTYGTSMFSLLRNFGSSIGVSVVIAYLSRNTQGNHAVLAEHVSPFNPNLNLFEIAQSLALGPDGGLGVINLMIDREAATIAYLDDFRMLMYATLAAIPMLALMRVPKRGAARPAGPS